MPIYATLILMGASFAAGVLVSCSLAYAHGYKDGETSKVRFMEKRALKRFDRGMDYIYKLWQSPDPDQA